jgi:hypothetical protein
MDSAAKSSALFVYYTYTQQTLKVIEAMPRCCAAPAMTCT